MGCLDMRSRLDPQPCPLPIALSWHKGRVYTFLTLAFKPRGLVLPGARHIVKPLIDYASP